MCQPNWLKEGKMTEPVNVLYLIVIVLHLDKFSFPLHDPILSKSTGAVHSCGSYPPIHPIFVIGRNVVIWDNKAHSTIRLLSFESGDFSFLQVHILIQQFSLGFGGAGGHCCGDNSYVRAATSSDHSLVALWFLQLALLCTLNLFPSPVLDRQRSSGGHVLHLPPVH